LMFLEIDGVFAYAIILSLSLKITLFIFKINFYFNYF
jgi:hypothetical protein